jgi:hypothetical protein
MKRFVPLFILLLAFFSLAPSWTGGVGPGPLGPSAHAFTGPPPGAFVAWFTADKGFTPSSGGPSASWTDQSSSHHVWGGNTSCPGTILENGLKAVSFPIGGGKCSFTSDITADLVAVALWPSQPDLVATNSWAKYVGGF